ELLLDRIHRLPRPQNLPQCLPRDVITILHHFTAKDKIMQAAQRSPEMAGKYSM
ncbi:Hypothetical predicted protein, partial [Pelobates cultripes]